MGIDTKLSPKVTITAMFVEAPSMSAIVSGPTNLQMRSIRRIRALRATLPVSSARKSTCNHLRSLA